MVSRRKDLAANSLAPRIIKVRGQKVILDANLALIYGVEVRALNQAVKRNLARFPHDFAFRLTFEEAISPSIQDHDL